VTAFVNGCSRIYRRVARAFPDEFRMICGDGLEQLGEDVLRLVWRDQGVAGIARLFADLVVRLPLEYVSTWAGRLRELTMTGDLFEGTWRANSDKSQWDPQHAPEQARITLEATDTGYLLMAYGIKDGQLIAERPSPIIADGRRHPIVDMRGRPVPGVPAGATAFGRRPDPRTIEGGAEVDGKTLGTRTLRVSEDGKTLTVMVEGASSKGPFKTIAVFDRVETDSYVPFG
jgi:hypothetical protein